MNKLFLTTLLLFTILFLPNISHAQISTGNKPILGDLASEMTANIYPEYPNPDQRIDVSLEMYTANLDSANIYWYLDNTLIQKGKGLKTFSFIAPSVNKTKTLLIRVYLDSGTIFDKSITINPMDLDILWEAASYTPAFYKGKALFPPQGKVKLLALTDYSNIIYKWTINGEVRQDLSGFGKNTALVYGPVLGTSMKVNIVATNPTTNITAEKTIFISPTNPTITFYENSPLYGILFNKALNTAPLKKDEMSVIAMPYNLSKEIMNDPIYKWKINKIVAPEITGRSAIFRKPEGVSGKSFVSLEIESWARPLQSADNSFSIIFEN